MQPLFDPKAPKRATNLSINSELLKVAREHGVNLSATLETALADQLRAQRAQQWRQTNSEAIAAYNHFVEENGTFSDGNRTF